VGPAIVARALSAVSDTAFSTAKLQRERLVSFVADVRIGASGALSNAIDGL
jgi:hypothetical protein